MSKKYTVSGQQEQIEGNAMVSTVAVDRSAGNVNENYNCLGDGQLGDDNRRTETGHTHTTPVCDHTRDSIFGGDDDNALTSATTVMAPTTPDQGGLAPPGQPTTGSCHLDETQTKDSHYGVMKLQGNLGVPATTGTQGE